MLYSYPFLFFSFLLTFLLFIPSLLLKAEPLPQEYGGYQLSYVQDKFSDNVITISGRKEPNKIPAGLVLKNAFAILAAEESIASNDESAEAKQTPHMFDLKVSDEKIEYKNHNKIVSRMCRQLEREGNDGIKTAAQLAMDSQAAEMEDLENFYRNKLRQLPPGQARKIESIMPEIRSSISYSYSDYVSLSDEVPEVIYMLLSRGCRQRNL